MSTVSRLNLIIDVLDTPNQPALALTSLSPTQLIEATLKEFQEIEYLGDSSENYQLLKIANGQALQPDLTLQEQLKDGERVRLVEKSPEYAPAGAVAARQPIYLRELNSGRVYKLNWLPAIIGRPDHNQPDNNLVAADMSKFDTGMRVSRRHAKIISSKEQDHFYLENMSGNVTKIKTRRGETVTFSPQQPRLELEHGDIIYLERSNLSLKFIVRNNPAGRIDQED
jgi:hypothetical protein